MKKITALLVSLLFILCMGTTVFAQDVTIRTTVPERHSVSIEVDGGGKVVANHRVCGASIQVARQSQQIYWLMPDYGKVLSALYYNGEDVTDQVRAGVFTAPALTDDAVLKAVFADAPSTPRDEQYDVTGTVTGPDGTPIPGATVDIGGQTGTTDENGNFIVEDVPTGTHTVTITDQDGQVIGIGEITVEEPDNGSMTVTADSNGNPVIAPGSGTTTISLTLTVGEDGVIAIENVKDVTAAQEEPGESDETDAENPSGGQTAGSDAPGTGDSQNGIVWGALLAASCMALAGTAFYRRKKNKNG